MKKIVYLFCVLLAVIACKDDDKIFEPQLESNKGGIVVFSETPRPLTISATEPSDFTFTAPLEDPNDNVVSYRLSVEDASGNYVDLGIELTSFPTDLIITSEMLANALNVSVTDFQFGQEFKFIGTVVNEAGITYSGIEHEYNPDTGEITGGNTDLDNIGSQANNYRDALRFNLIISCPPTSDFLQFEGTYNVTSHTYQQFGFPTGTNLQLIVGPGPNQLTIVGGIYQVMDSTDLILNVNEDGTAVISPDVQGNVAWYLNPDLIGKYNGGDGLVFYCTSLQRIMFNLKTECCIDNFVVLEKN